MMNNPYDPRLRLVRRNRFAQPAPDPGPAPIGINPGITPPPLPPAPPAPPPGFVPTARDPYGLGPNVQPPSGLAPGDQQTDPNLPNYIPPGFHRWSDGSIHSTPEATFRGLQQNVGLDINTPLPTVNVGPPTTGPNNFNLPPWPAGSLPPGGQPPVQTIPSTPVPTAPPMSQHLMNHPPHIQRQIAALAGKGVTDDGSAVGARYARLVARAPVPDPGVAPPPVTVPGTPIAGVPGVPPAVAPTPGILIDDPNAPLPVPTPAPGTVIPGVPLGGAPSPVDLRRLAPPFQPSPGLLGGPPPRRPNLPLPPFDPSAQLLGQSRNPRRRY